jgi:aspartyl-tRNA(Asn)/glutamyl-tRNA(Gln) amidotransferase subunit C
VNAKSVPSLIAPPHAGRVIFPLAGLGWQTDLTPTDEMWREQPVALSPDDVAALARLARIEMTADELTHLAPQLEVILEAVATVSDVAADDIPPTSHALPLTNVFRDDGVHASLPVAEVRAGAPAAELDRFRVPRILGEEA